MRFRRLADQDLRGKRVFIRADLNVPQDDAGRITDDTRIQASVPGIRMALDKGAAVMVTSHLGRPKEGVFDEKDSLAPVAVRLGSMLGIEIKLLQNWTEGVHVNPGEVVLLENCRFNPGEKADDEALSRKVAALCDVYVNDAFGTAHRAEATTHGAARFAKLACAGPLMAAELDALGLFVDDVLLALLHFGPVDRHVADGDAEVLCFLDLGPDVGVLEKGLRGDAAAVETRAAEEGILLDDGDLEAELARADAGDVSARTASDDDDVVLLF